MKKKYIQPSLEVLSEDSSVLLSGSVKSDNGIGYGGVDTEGEKDPSSRRYSFDYDDEDW